MICVAVICVGTCGMTDGLVAASRERLSHINTSTIIRAIHLVKLPRPPRRASSWTEPRSGIVDTVNLDQVPRPVRGKPRAGEFVFARLRYDSGDWDYNPKVAANVLNSIVEYTNITVYPEEVVITADSDELLAFPFLFMTGPQAGALQRSRARAAEEVRRTRRLPVFRRLQSRRRRPLCDLVRAGNASRLSRARGRSTSCRARIRSIDRSSSFPTARRRPRTN